MQHADKQEPGFGLDAQLLMGIATTGDSDSRLSLARQVAAFLTDPDAPAAEREQVMPVALRLAEDADIDVRRTLADGLAIAGDLDRDLVFAISSDEDGIALPFLAATPSLDTARMLAVLAAGDVARQAIIALRPDLPDPVIDAITAEMPLAVNALLLENAAVRLHPSHYCAIYHRFGEDQEVLDLLLARSDLPPVLRIIQARRAASNLGALLQNRDWMSGSAAAELVIDAEEHAVLEVLTGATAQQRTLAVAFLIDNELLTPSLVVRAACLGAMDVVADCLASLADMPLSRVREQMYGNGRFKALHARCGLPQSCYWTLKAACDVARDEKEDGIHLSAEEFGARLIEKLLTRYESMPAAEQPRNLTFIGRFAAEKPRRLATRLKADLQRAA